MGERQRVASLPPEIQRRTQRKLRVLNNSGSLNELMAVPGNRLEALGGDRAGQHSIRINRQWRICFIWDGSDAYDVEVVDYH